MITPNEYDITIYQNAALVLPLTFEISCMPVDLTDMPIVMQIRPTYSSQEVILEATEENGRVFKTDPVNGMFEIRLTGEDTKGMSFRLAVYDVLINKGTENAIRIMQGTVRVSRGVSR